MPPHWRPVQVTASESATDTEHVEATRSADGVLTVHPDSPGGSIVAESAGDRAPDANLLERDQDRVETQYEIEPSI